MWFRTSSSHRCLRAAIGDSAHPQRRVTGVTEELPERLSRLVYLDTVVPQDGQAMLDILGEPTATMLRGLVERAGDGWRLPLPPGAPARLTEHPFACLTQPLRLGNPIAAQVQRTYIRCTHDPTGQHGSMTTRMATRARSEGWDVRELESDHEPSNTLQRLSQHCSPSWQHKIAPRKWVLLPQCWRCPARPGPEKAVRSGAREAETVAMKQEPFSGFCSCAKELLKRLAKVPVPWYTADIGQRMAL